MEISGIIENVFTKDELFEFRDVLLQYGIVESQGNQCYGVDYKHPFYDGFMEKYFSKIQEAFGDHDMLPIFGMYLVENKPWRIHSDDYHQSPTPGSKFMSFLSPISVDFDTNLVSESDTIILNESSNSKTRDEWIKTAPVKENNIEDMWDEYLSHNDKYINGIYVPDKHTLNAIHNWKLGDLIWWDSFVYHDTSNFLAKGHTSKQALVTHTYKPNC